MQYRREIDGLRAVAVVPVILFHAGLGLRGGYVGVDVFFVISGYLITSLIIADLERHDFSLLRFYERRARRILPALFVVLAVSLVFAWAWMLPSELKNFSQSLTAVSFFLSNVLLWRESGYFDSAAELKPLLHTWSLAVEEQYYLLFPLLLMALWRFGRAHALTVVLLLALASLALSQWASGAFPVANFYLAPTRAWELFAGSLCAMLLHRRTLAENDFLAGVGLSAILVAMVVFDETTRFPSLYALLPVGGAALIILFAGRQGWTGRLLASAPFVAVGLISYSAYLWHQPLLAFARIRSFETPGPVLMASMALASLGLAALTWRFVEQPFRTGPRPLLPSRRAVFAASAVGTAVFIGSGVYGHLTTELVTREGTYGACNWLDGKTCYVADPPGATVAIWGDSFADAFTPSLGRALNDRGATLYPFIMLSCPSILGVMRNEEERMAPGFAEACRDHNAAVAQSLAELRPDVVVLTSHYVRYLNPDRFANARGEPVLVPEGEYRGDAMGVVLARFADTVARLQETGAAVVLVTPHPVTEEFDTDRRKLAIGLIPTVTGDAALARDTRDRLVAALAERRVEVAEVSVTDIFCGDQAGADRCPVMQADGDFLLFDGQHLSLAVARKLAARIADRIAIDAHAAE